MEQRKTNKKKLVVALALLALIVVASVITTVVLVLAAQQQTVQSNVNVTYTVTDVSATISGRYGKRNPALSGTDSILDANAMVNPDGANTQTINTYDDEATFTMAPSGTIELTSKENYVVFEYKFENNAAENPFTIGLSYTDDFNISGAANPVEDYNVVVGYAVSEGAPLDEDANYDIFDNLYSATGWAEGWADLLDEENVPETIATCNTITYVYVIVQIADTNAKAGFSGAFNFALAGTK